MSQSVRDMLANRRFTIPLMILLAFCLVGLILIGVVLIWQPDFLDDGTTVAQASVTSPPEQTALPTVAPTATETATPRPSPTLVPLGTQPATAPEASPSSAEGDETQEAAEQTTTAVTGETATVEEGSTPEATATVVEEGGSEEATPAPTEPTVEEGELAQTGIGWGLVFFSGAALGLLAIVARRLRLTL